MKTKQTHLSAALTLMLLTHNAQFYDRVLLERNMHRADHTLGGAERKV